MDDGESVEFIAIADRLDVERSTGVVPVDKDDRQPDSGAVRQAADFEVSLYACSGLSD